jgi:hypothetical protein
MDDFDAREHPLDPLLEDQMSSSRMAADVE